MLNLWSGKIYCCIFFETVLTIVDEAEELKTLKCFTCMRKLRQSSNKSHQHDACYIHIGALCTSSLAEKLP
jgi:hypothetical protein